MAESTKTITEESCSGIPQYLIPTYTTMMTKTSHMFEKKHIRQMLSKFNEVATTKDNLSVINYEQFEKEVFPILFSEPDDPQVKEMLRNSLFLQRIFSTINKTKRPEGITFEELIAGIGYMFSGDDDDLSEFHFHIYDVLENDQISQEEMFDVLESFFNARMMTIEEQTEDEHDKEKIETQLKLKREVGPKKLKEIIASTFTLLGKLNKLNSEGAITFKGFKEAFSTYHDLLDWGELIGDLLDALDAAEDEDDGELHVATRTVSIPSALDTVSDPTERELLAHEQ